MKRLLLTIVAAAAAVLPLPALNRIPAWLEDAVIYHIYPSSYMDSDGDGIGDLRGIESRLDYIRSLGVTAIWISPIFESEFVDGGYDVTDFYRVDPRFGTNADLVSLVRTAHSKGIRVLLDLVAGHTSDKNAWFLQSRNGEPYQRYTDYYIWTDSRDKVPNGNFIKSDAPRDGNYMKNYFDAQPALNYGYANPDPAEPWQQHMDAPGPMAVRNELKEIMSFWVDKGVDGYRVDMAMSIVKNDPDKSGTMRFWRDVIGWFESRYPECVLMSEWGDPEKAIPAGFHVDLMIDKHTQMYRPLMVNAAHRGGPKVCYFEAGGSGGAELREFAANYSRVLAATRGHGFSTMPTASHDNWRVNTNGRNTPEQIKAALTMFLLMPWPPIIYYGDEIGMRTVMETPPKEGSLSRSGRNRSPMRTPMQWDSTPNAGFSTAPKDSLYLPIDPSEDRPTVAAQESDPESILNYVREVLALRRENPALGTRGEWRVLSDLETAYPLVYERRLGEERFIVAINPSARRAVTPVSGIDGRPVVIFGDSDDFSYLRHRSGDRIAVKPFGAVVCRIEPAAK